jgi:hypothetical protein
MLSGVRRSLGRIRSTTTAKAATRIQIPLGIAAIGGKVEIFSRVSSALLDSPVLLERDATITYPVKLVLECTSLIIVPRQGQIRSNFNSLFKTDSKSVLGVRIFQFGRQTIVFRSANEVLANPLAVLEVIHTVM